MASGVYVTFVKNQFDGTSVVDFDTDAIHVALVNSAYVSNFAANLDAHDFFDDVGASEVSGTGYTSGGQSIVNKTVTKDTANNRVDIDGDDMSWPSSTITAYGAVIYKKVATTTSVSPLIALIDFGGAQTSSSGTFAITWSSAGFLRVSA